MWDWHHLNFTAHMSGLGNPLCISTAWGSRKCIFQMWFRRILCMILSARSLGRCGSSRVIFTFDSQHNSYYFWGLAHFFACLLAGLLTSSLDCFLASFTCLLWGSWSSSGNEGDFYVDNAVTLLPGFLTAATDISGRCKVQAMWVLWRGQAEVWWQIWWVGALPHWIHSWTWWPIYPFQQRWVQCHICVSRLQ